MGSNEPIVVFNDGRVPHTANYPVLIGYTDVIPGIPQILSKWDMNNGDDLNVDVGDHHEQHEYPNHDTTWVNLAQFTWLLVLPVGGNTVMVYGTTLYFGNTDVKINNQLLDLTSHQPGSGARWVLLEALSSGIVNVVDGDVLADQLALNGSNLPAKSADSKRMTAIKLYNQADISRDPRPGKVDDFLDLRLDGYASSAGTNSFDVAGAIHAAPEKITLDPDDEFGIRDSADDLLKHITMETLRHAMRYRQFVYTNDGSGFQFVQTADGEPVMVLQNTE